ncbi:LacI family DNA-binding transcriptional regulator [Devosia sp.]|uniref:LacI family DNA-binding transcriptional regulator n=1 Tax=Devosia sp. TaxID=1871048 RepID=UPI0035B32288
MARRPTIVDVARLAGVSKSTAARAMSDSAEVNDATRDKVRKAALAVGYERNHLAVGMRSGRSGLFGLVIPDIANPFWAEVARGAQDLVAAHDASLLVFSSDWDHEREASHLRALRQARVEGAIVNPVSDSVDEFGRFGLPFVLIGSSAERFPDTPSIGSDIRQAVRLGLDHLEQMGHRSPALILGPKSRLARARFLRSVHEHCLERDIDPASLPVESGDYTVEGGFSAMQRLLEQQRDAHLTVFCANDLMALGAMMAARVAGRECPRDVSVLGFDGVPAGAFSWPGLTTIEKPARELGRRAAEALFDHLAGRALDGRTYLPCRLIERGSLADLRVVTPLRIAGGGRT